MRALRSWFGFLGTLALAGLPAPSAAQAVGDEFQINTYTTETQKTRSGQSVAADASGNFVVVWQSDFQDGSGAGAFAQRYDSAGVPLGSEFRVNSVTSDSQRYPLVAVAADGDFVVVWQSFTQDGSQWGVFGQRYDSAGSALGGEFRVNSYTTSSQRYASVASDASGNFVVVWQSSDQDDGTNGGVFGQRYDSEGGTLGGEFRVNSYTPGSQSRPAVASDASGNFVVVWESLIQDGEGGGIFGQRYDSGGVPQGGEFRVNSYTTSNQRDASVALDASGNFVVAWQSPGEEGSGQLGVFGQRYDSAGVAQGDEFQINSYTSRIQGGPSVAYDANSNFVVAWQSDQSQDGFWAGVFGQRYDSAGVAQGDEFQINSETSLDQQFASVAATGADRFVVVWTSDQQDGDWHGVFGQRYDFGARTIHVESPNSEVKWRVGSQKEIRWTHTLGSDAIFRIKLDRNGDGEYEELIAAAAPADSDTTGSLAWNVTGPPSRNARVRVAWTDDPAVSDASDVSFQIKPAE